MGQLKLAVGIGLACLSGLLFAVDLDPPISNSDRLVHRASAEPRALQTDASQNLDPCRDSRAAPHRAGGRRVARSSVPLGPRPCLFHTGDQSWEPTMGITSDGTIFYGTERGDTTVLTVRRSTDKGRTWTDVTPLQEPSALGDPYLYVNRETDRVFAAELKTDLCAHLAFSDDNGESWTANPQVCGLADHETVFDGPPVSTPTTVYPNFVYYCAASPGIGPGQLQTGCLRSIDGGLSFTASGEPAFPPSEGCLGPVGHGVADSDGVIYLPKGWCGQPHLAISRDEGRMWERVQVADNGMASGDVNESHEAGVAVDRLGNIYYVWIAFNDRPYLAISRDGGVTWSRPKMIAPPGVRMASLPALDVGSPGRIAMAYMGANPSDGDIWNGYVTITANALDASPLFYSASVNKPSDPLVRGGCGTERCQGAGDFFDVVIGPEGTAWAAFVDACVGRCKDSAVGNNAADGIVGRLMGGPRLR